MSLSAGWFRVYTFEHIPGMRQRHIMLRDGLEIEEMEEWRPSLKGAKKM